MPKKTKKDKTIEGGTFTSSNRQETASSEPSDGKKSKKSKKS